MHQGARRNPAPLRQHRRHLRRDGEGRSSRRVGEEGRRREVRGRADEEGKAPSRRQLHPLRRERGGVDQRPDAAPRDAHLRSGRARAARSPLHAHRVARAGGSLYAQAEAQEGRRGRRARRQGPRSPRHDHARHPGRRQGDRRRRQHGEAAHEAARPGDAGRHHRQGDADPHLERRVVVQGLRRRRASVTGSTTTARSRGSAASARGTSDGREHAANSRASRSATSPS